MKRIIIFILLVFSVLKNYSQIGDTLSNIADTSWLQKGTILKYSITFNQTNADMELEILSLYPRISYKWKFSKPISTEGKLTILKSAMDGSFELSNDFNQSDVALQDKTSMFMSKKFMDIQRKSKMCMLNFGFGPAKFMLTEEQYYEVLLNNVKTKIPVIYFESDKPYKFWVLNSTFNPLIVKSANMRFVVTLKEIITKK